MIVTVRLFARARDLAGADALTLDLPPGATVAALRERLGRDSPALAPLLARSFLAVNAEYAADEQLLADNAEVALLPPVSGGEENPCQFLPRASL